MPKLCPKLILEGTRLTHKTDIAFALNEHPRIVGPRKYRYHSPLVSAEWCALTNTPWGRGIINFEASEAARAMQTYRTWVKLFELQRYYSWIVDRFHISTQMHQQLYFNRRYRFPSIEKRLSALDFRLVLCTRKPGSFATALEARLAVSGNPAQYDDPERFVREQETLRRLVAASVLQSLVIDVSDDDVPSAVEGIADWLEETGGLYMNEGDEALTA